MSLKHIILGLLRYEAASGYELNKVFQESVWHFWQTEQSQIYRALHKLEEMGWVEIEVIRQENLPDKKLYSLTAAGEVEFQRWLATPQKPSSVHEAWLGQLFFGGGAAKEVVVRGLQARQAMLEKAIAVFEQELPANAAHYAAVYGVPEEMAFWSLTMDYGLKRLQFERAWIEEAMQQVDHFT